MKIETPRAKRFDFFFLPLLMLRLKRKPTLIGFSGSGISGLRVSISNGDKLEGRASRVLFKVNDNGTLKIYLFCTYAPSLSFINQIPL